MSKTIVTAVLTTFLSVSACGTMDAVPNYEIASTAPEIDDPGAEPGPDLYYDPAWDYEPDEIDCMVSGVGNWSGGMCHF